MAGQREDNMESYRMKIEFEQSNSGLSLAFCSMDRDDEKKSIKNMEKC
jgi:hypothetical protein